MTVNLDNVTVFTDLSPSQLVERGLESEEGRLTDNGAFLVTTGQRTGRSPADRFIVKEPSTEDSIDWGGVNRPFDEGKFDALWERVSVHTEEHNHYVAHLHVGAHIDHYLPVKVTTETAWQSLFGRNMFIRPEQYNPKNKEEWTVLNAASFVCQPDRDGTNSDGVVIINFAQRKVLLAGMRYAGEMKKSMFSVQNFLLPEKDVMSMHCSANVGEDGDTTLFFGLSGTGKTTLSADPDRYLIGDDEHGWSKGSVFNLEGGCYAKTINLNAEAEPEIYATTQKFGTVIENMLFDPETLELDFNDDSLTANMRCAYPLDYISNASDTALGGHPKNIIMLTCDAFGVLPPIARLTPAQAMYHFLSGFTSKVAGTERGVTEPEPTFSTCFGAPFMPRRPEAYGNLLRDKIAKHGATCWLVNTGWTGGAYGTGSRMPIKATRALLTAALDGSLAEVKFRRDPNFGFDVPVAVDGVDPALLDPRSTWADTAAYDAQAAKLVHMFADNFEKYLPYIDEDVKAAAIS